MRAWTEALVELEGRKERKEVSMEGRKEGRTKCVFFCDMVHTAVCVSRATYDRSEVIHGDKVRTSSFES